MEPREFASMRTEVARRPGLDGPGRRAALTGVTDAWLQELFAQARASTAQPMCLVAVGGYGRRELTLGSDLDLVLLHPGGPGMTPIWVTAGIVLAGFLAIMRRDRYSIVLLIWAPALLAPHWRSRCGRTSTGRATGATNSCACG